jgi:hypothetical protein
VSPDQVIAAVRELAQEAPDAAMRAQLHSLATAIECLEAQQHGAEAELAVLAAGLEAALADDDEESVILAARRLASRHRSLAGVVDWSAVSGG